MTSISSFKNYESKRFLGQFLVFGSDEVLGTFEKVDSGETVYFSYKNVKPQSKRKT